MAHLEGRICVLAALQSRRRRCELLLVDERLHPEKRAGVEAEAAARQVAIKLVSREELDRLTHARSHGGVALVCGPRRLTTPAELMEKLDAVEAPLLVVLEGVDDGRNLGYVLRTAEALGADAVLLKKHLWDFDETQVSRASSGAFERMELVKFEGVELIRRLQKRGVKLWGCMASARRSLEAAPLSGPVAVAIGGEKRGLSGAIRKVCDGVLKIPTREGRSLALSQAAAIVIAEAARQRRA